MPSLFLESALKYSERKWVGFPLKLLYKIAFQDGYSPEQLTSFSEKLEAADLGWSMPRGLPKLSPEECAAFWFFGARCSNFQIYWFTPQGEYRTQTVKEYTVRTEDYKNT